MVVVCDEEVFQWESLNFKLLPNRPQVNVCKLKALTNMRAASKDKTESLVPAVEMSLDTMVEYIMDDEVSPYFIPPTLILTQSL